MTYGFQDDDSSQDNGLFSWRRSPSTELINLAIDEPAVGLTLGGILLAAGVAIAMAGAAFSFTPVLTVGGMLGGVGGLMCGGALIADACNGLKAGIEFIWNKTRGQGGRKNQGSDEENTPPAPRVTHEAQSSSVSATRSGSLKKAFAGNDGAATKSHAPSHPRKAPAIA